MNKRVNSIVKSRAELMNYKDSYIITSVTDMALGMCHDVIL